MFSNLYDMEVLCEEAFLKWKEEVNDLQPGKGQALFQVNQWLVWLEQADEDSEEEDWYLYKLLKLTQIPLSVWTDY